MHIARCSIERHRHMHPALRRAINESTWLSPEEERDALANIARLRESGGIGLIPAVRAFEGRNLRLVASIAATFVRHLSARSMSLDDLIGYGMIGLRKAVMRFDVSTGYKFSTYAHWWIRHAIGRELLNLGHEIRVPVHVYDNLRRLAKARAEFESAHGRQPDHAELAAVTGLEAREVARLAGRIGVLSVLSLDAPMHGPDGELHENYLSLQAAPVDEYPDAVIERREDVEAVRRAVADLPSIRALVLRRRYEDDATLSDVGEEIGLSRERARQIQVDATASVRRSIEAERRGPVRRRPVSRQMEMAL